MIFKILSEKERIQTIADIMDKGYESISITLESGDIVYGDIQSHTYQEYCKYSKTKKDNFKKGAPISDELKILFPDGSGKKFGVSFIALIPNDKISSIEGIKPFFDFPDGYLRNLPNPFSTQILTHNFPILEQNDGFDSMTPF